MTDVVRLTTALADRYRIERELGAGGMATVYLAHDVRHDRRVALKVLRPELSAILGAERFVHEIKTTANLQHPHILSLFDSGEADGLVYYVMPYVEGESLRDRLSREKQLPVEDAIRIAREVADALQYAHTQGVVHRDIKPENILLHGGHAMVADFGIALAAAKVEGGSRMTETGMSLGTPHYMSPEQAMGEREITPKADIYALGCVLYEMLTAEPPFVGATAQAIIARVMTEEPRSLTMQRKTIPPHVEAAVEKALEKLPADRWASAAEFGAALADTGYGRRETEARTRASRTALPPYRRTALPWALAFAALAAAAWGWLRPQQHVPPPPVARFGIRMSPEVVTTVQGQAIAMSPDGSRVVYVASSNNGQELYTRLLSQSVPTAIPGTVNALSPFISADGQYVGFVIGTRLLKAPFGGGPVLPVADVGSSFRGGSWSERDTILYADDSGLHVVAASGGTPTLLAAPDSGSIESYRWPEFLPGATTALFSIGSGAVDRLAVITLDSRVIRRLDVVGTNPHYVRQGFVAMALISDGTAGVGTGSLVAVPFDARRAVVTGAPIPVAESVQVGVNSRTAKLGMSRDGAMVFASGSVGLGNLAMVSRSGAVRNLGDTHFFSGPRISPDGRRIAAQVVDTGNDIWIYDIATKTLTRLTFDRTASRPIWTPDGRRIVYMRRGAADDDLAWIPADGSGPAQTLIAAPENQMSGAFTPDGRMMVLREQGVGKRRISYLTFDSTPTMHPLLANQAENYSPTLSPDGKWMAYNSDESGRTEIYVRPFPGPGGRWQVSRDGGGEPRWSPTGREIFYRHGPSMMAASVQAGTTFTPGEIKELFRMNGPQGVTYTNYDVTRDGQDFIMVVPIQNNDQSVIVMLNWFENQPARTR